MMENQTNMPPMGAGAPRARRGGNWLLLLVIVIAVLGGGWWWVNDGRLGAEAKSNYQAVFLSNNQVYFGRVSSPSGDYLTLTDIYYLQVAQPLQPSEPATNINLVKLGNELHGPADRMEINRDHVLFIEDLKTDSQVVQAIEKYIESQTKP